LLKKIVIAVCILALFVFLIYAFQTVNKEDDQRFVVLNEANAEIEPAKQEINELYLAIEELRAQSYEAESITPRIIYGYYTSSVEELHSDGAIVLDADAPQELIDAAEETGRDILYFYSENRKAPAGGDATILRSAQDSGENRESIKGTISCHVDSSSAEMLDNGAVCIPYIYVKSDDTSIESRLNQCKDVMIIVFNQEVTVNVDALMARFQDGSLVKSTVNQAEQAIREQYRDRQIWSSGKNLQIAEMEEHIAQLQQQIEDTYAQTREKREGLSKEK